MDIDFTAVIDSREQNPLDLKLKDDKPVKTEVGTLYTGDYSIRGLENHVAIERKSLSDLMGCIGGSRERFEKEIIRLKAYPVRALVVESTWADIEAGAYRSKVHPSAAIGSLLGWVGQSIPVLMTGDHKKAGVFVARILYITAKRRYHELKQLKG
jgi:ERCC4-type nuclease